MPTIDQPTPAPTRKVAAGGGTGAATLVLLWVASLLGVEMPEPVAGAIVLLASGLAAYFTRERGPRRPQVEEAW